MTGTDGITKSFQEEIQLSRKPTLLALPQPGTITISSATHTLSQVVQGRAQDLWRGRKFMTRPQLCQPQPHIGMWFGLQDVAAVVVPSACG